MNVINIIIMLIFFFPLRFFPILIKFKFPFLKQSVLLYVQINNFILNKTTPERYGFAVLNKNSRSLSVLFLNYFHLFSFLFLFF